jgi:5-formyltetrahydrofolate cyclo-ligase
MSDDEIALAKRGLRVDCEARRRTASHHAGATAGAGAVKHFFGAIEVPAGCVVSGYWPMRHEFDVRPLLGALHGRGHVCALPLVTGKGQPLEFRVWSPGAPLVEAAFGTQVPPETAPVVTPALLLVPMLAFDTRGYRLGYGGGFYDRTLDGLRTAGLAPLAVGCAFQGQRIDAVPVNATDQRLDWVVTERGATRITLEASGAAA